MNVTDTLSTSVTSATSAAGSTSEAGSADRFLKLLVTQLQNQDPLNPMDNAELTSQLAQINTVTGIENLNTSVQGLNSQFLQMQALQGASLIGRDVTVTGNQLALDARGAQAEAGFALSGPADAVQVEILNGGGQVVETMQMGALESGRHAFDWDASGHPDASGYTFRVTATLGAAAVTSTPLMLDRVQSVGLDGSTGLVLTLERSGAVPYGEVHALN
jgi:flagellar basal-body rod modification protein FlgD